MKLVQCSRERHAGAILAIFNDAILKSTALYEYQPRTMETMDHWFHVKSKGNFPIIGVENEDGVLMGFGSFGTFRAFPGYKYTVEHSVYVDARFRGKGVGKRLLQELISLAEKQDYHVMVGVIDASNQPSIRLHESNGFSHCARIRQCGYKFGKWLDVVFYQRILQGPATPLEA